MLIIGGGDGALLRTALTDRAVKSIRLVEIDAEVVACAREFFPLCTESFANRKVELVFDDGARYVHYDDQEYDVIMVDAPDPVGAGAQLFKLGFYRDCFRLLSRGGVLSVQSESPYLFPHISRRVLKSFSKLFRNVEQMAVIVPSYPGGSIGFTFGVKE